MAASLTTQLRKIPRLDGALCAQPGTDREVFFAPRWDRRKLAAAAAICRDCPARVECDNYATNRPERNGVWAGKDRRPRRQVGALR